MMLRHLILAAALFSVSACAHQYESAIRDALMDAGVSRPMASCVAARMVDRLSKAQLRDLARLGKGSGRPARDMSLSQVLDHYRAALDPEVYEVLTRAGLGCAMAI